MSEIINRVATSSLVSIDLEEYMSKAERVIIDLKDFLHEGIVLKEKEFRDQVKQHPWAQYSGKNVRIICSEDTIIPVWAYMIIASKLGNVNTIAFGDEQALEQKIIDQAIASVRLLPLTDAKVVIKGCGGLKSRDYAYVELTKALCNTVSSLMYGEPCSTVPVFKQQTLSKTIPNVDK